MNQFNLILEMKSDWHIGSGKEGGAYADALVMKDSQRLPFIPGKSLKGLLRDAIKTAAACNWYGAYSDRIASLLLGREGLGGIHAQGVMQVSSARLSEQERHFIASQGIEKHLYRVLQSTAIEQATGTAKPTSLRGIEVVVPMQLTANIQLNESHPRYNEIPQFQEKFKQWLSDTVTLITELGHRRHRGLGQVAITVREV